MNRQRTKVSKRTAELTDRIGFGSRLVAPAKNLEYRGIITTYKLHDRALGNRRARRKFEQHPPKLDNVQQRVLADLEAQDYAIVPFAELVPDEALRDAVDREGATFVAATRESLGADSHDVRDVLKDYLVRRGGLRDQAAALDAPWFSCCISGRLLDVANAYLRMWSKLEYVDLWYSVPVSLDSERVQSQRWHRDFDDRHLLKAFLYLVDVDAETGPLEFVAGSARGNELADFLPWHPLSQPYPSQEAFENAVLESAIRTFTAPKGTLILCNTSGFHRGGFATGRPRVLATATYCSTASLKALTQRNYRLPRRASRRLPGPQRFAVT